AGFDSVVAAQRIVEAKHGDRGAQHIHGRELAGHHQEIVDLFRNVPVAYEVRLQSIQFGLLRQTAVPKQIDDLLKGCTVGQGVDVEALVTEDSAISIDKTNI